ncbi:MAG: mechanosensitive ion channel family protein [Gemmataceae bacterium]|nr:mechanosensitive ion channel family protein [Gemmataceae bacterium]
MRSPREALKTLYYSIMAYDWRPELIDDAISCLQLDPSQCREPAEAARLAIQLENVLKELGVPLNAVPEDLSPNLAAVVYEGDGCAIFLSCDTDGLWRFDRATVSRIPAMYRTVMARHRDLQGERAVLKEGYTDASATMRRFMIDSITGDFYAAAQALDLSSIGSDQREDRGPILAQQLACVIQRRGWTYYQEIPNIPGGTTFTWHADRNGRIALDRVRQADGKDAWQFIRQTVKLVPQMYEQALNTQPDVNWVRLNRVVPLLRPDMTAASIKQRPASVPAMLGSPQAVLQGFFRAMDAAETSDAKLVEALEFLDLKNVPQTERKVRGGKLATQLEAILRQLDIDLAIVSDEWNASPQIIGQNQGMRVEILRQRDGCWRFSQATVTQVPALFEKLSSQMRADRERTSQLESARDTMSTFLTAINRHDHELASTCLDLSDIHPAAHAEVGPVLAYKLKFVIDRIARVYIQAVPDEPDGARYVFYRGDMGKIVIARKPDGPRKGRWLFTTETLQRVEPMFRALLHAPPADTMQGIDAVTEPCLSEAPGIWVRSQLPDWAQQRMEGLDLFQWLGLVLAGFSAWLAARVVLSKVFWVGGWMLRRGGSALSPSFVCQKMRPMTWVVAWWLFFRLIAFLDLPMGVLDTIMPLKKFIMAGLLGCVVFQLIDLVVAIFTNSELLRPHRSLSDMVVPVLMRAMKGAAILMVATYYVYQIGAGESLGQFLTGLGVAGLTVSLAAQDALKSFFGTLLLISERSFKLGDRIKVGSQEGVVEQVGFRSTRLRTADGSLLTIPNATIASTGIDNVGVRSFRPYRTAVFIGYDTSFDQLALFRQRLGEWLMQNPGIDRDKVDIGIQRFTEYGVELTVNLMLVAATGEEEKLVRDEVNSTVLRLAQLLEVRLANGKKPPEGESKTAWPARAA